MLPSYGSFCVPVPATLSVRYAIQTLIRYGSNSNASSSDMALRGLRFDYLKGRESLNCRLSRRLAGPPDKPVEAGGSRWRDGQINKSIPYFGDATDIIGECLPKRNRPEESRGLKSEDTGL